MPPFRMPDARTAARTAAAYLQMVELDLQSLDFNAELRADTEVCACWGTFLN